VLEETQMANTKGLHDGHRARMRKRFEVCGCNFTSFEDHEILEMILFNCYPRRNTNEIAHCLLNKFGTLENVVTAPVDELCEIKYVSVNTAAQLKFYGELLKLFDENADKIIFDLGNVFELEKYIKFVAETISGEAIILILQHRDKTVKSRIIDLDDSADFNSDEVIKIIKESFAVNIATVHVLPFPQETDMEKEFKFVREILHFLFSDQTDLIDHCIYNGENLRSFRDESLM
jgi:DNA repair protein RadC